MESIAGGNSNSFFIDESDVLWGCGSPTFISTARQDPGYFSKVQLPKNTLIQGVASGKSHNLFLDASGNAWSCGKCDNNHGLGFTYQNKFTAEAKIIPDSPKFLSISTFYEHSLFIDTDNNVWGCGNNNSSQLSSTTFTQSITQVHLPCKINSIAAGYQHSVFLDLEGTPWVCGGNSCGELGLGDLQNRRTPVKVENLTAIREIYSGCQHTIFLAVDGSLWGAGFSGNGELGII